jgi:hypothetical protein
MYLCYNVRTDSTISSWGIMMENFIWHWNQGNITIFTRDRQRAEEAMKNGIEVVGEKITSKIIRY